jgi:hypothetical protein
MAFYELRQYSIRPGKMEAWIKCMEEEIIPFQVAKGMVITGSDDSVYVWMRRFENEAERASGCTRPFMKASTGRACSARGLASLLIARA